MTAIIPDGGHEFNVLPFGLRNSPASFQRLIHAVLRVMSNFAVACILMVWQYFVKLS